MNSFKDSLTYWSSILGTTLSVMSLSESSPLLAVVGFLCLVGSVVALLFAEKQRQRLRLATIKVEGRTIDSLNVANLGRRLNRNLIIQEAEQVAVIAGEDMVMTWRYRGYCRALHEAVIEFSIDADNHIPFERLECFGYDLHHDPERMHRIRPVLLGADGLSKKIAIPLLERLSKREPFDVLLTCLLPGCIKTGVDYYTSTISVAQERVPAFAVRLVFLKERPEWLRVYECDESGVPKLLRDLCPSREVAELVEYADQAHDVPAQSTRIYVFRRTVTPRDTERT